MNQISKKLIFRNFAFRRFCTSQNVEEFAKVSGQINNSEDVLKKKIIWRSGNLGMLELDVLVGKFAKRNIPNLTLPECKEYEQEVLSKETSDLFFMLIENKEQDPPEMGKFLKWIKKEGRNLKE